ncbi:MAG: stage V sporulation protein AA [Lachnospiraceae bacterium]|nr:stage V sporulation protein AA [Lachnospiraceae bacterium]
MSDTVVYLKMDTKVKIAENTIQIGDLGKIYCQDVHITNKIKPLKVHVFQQKDKGRCVISALKVTELIYATCPSCTVDIVGATETIVEQVKAKHSPEWTTWLKVAAVSLLCFFGTMYTIMAYHNDINITELFGQIHELIMGQPGNGYTALEAAYSLGLAMGIIIFYNHIGKRRLTPDPSPVEVEMRVYGDDINTALVEMANREEKTIDVS